MVLINPALAFIGNGIVAPTSSLAQGQNETLSVNVINGTPPYSYLWEFNGQNLVHNTTSFVITANSADIGTAAVNVIVTDSVGEVIVSNVLINIQPPPGPFVPDTGGLVPGTGSGSGPVVAPPTTVTTSIVPTESGNGTSTAQNLSTTVATTTVGGTSNSTGAGGQNSGNTVTPPSSGGLSGLEVDGGILIVIALILTIGYYLYMNNLSVNRVSRRKRKR